MEEIKLRPSYWASVSGGKDSLLMLKLILENKDVYPLDGVIHFELEIDYPFIQDVVDYMEDQCNKLGVKFVRIKPRKNWYELYEKWGFPTRKARWCNSQYKLDALRQLKEFLEAQNKYLVSYIGYCVDEENRYNKRSNSKEIYPLVDMGINEEEVLKWARTQSIFNNYYLTNRRCGCMYCPMTSRINFAYLYKYYPKEYNKMIELMKATEKIREEELGHPFSVISSNPKYNAEYLDNNIKNKWLAILEEKETQYV